MEQIEVVREGTPPLPLHVVREGEASVSVPGPNLTFALGAAETLYLEEVAVLEKGRTGREPSLSEVAGRMLAENISALMRQALAENYAREVSAAPEEVVARLYEDKCREARKKEGRG